MPASEVRDTRRLACDDRGVHETPSVDVTMRPAAPSQAAFLSDLALRSKACWGYDPAFLSACRDELTIHPETCDGVHVVVAQRGGPCS